MDSLNCPLTCDIFHDPVIGQDGHTYERKDITAWLQQHGTSPITREPMTIESLRPNHIVRKMIEEFAAVSKKTDYQFHLNVDVRKTETQPWLRTFSKAIYKAEWVGRQGPPIVLIKIDGAKANREALFYVQLSSHPHIVRTFGLVESDLNSIMFVQEYAEKGDLAGLLRENNFKPIRNVFIEIFIQIIDAMICLADNKIVHGDLACRNVLVFRCNSNIPEENLVKLTDFGLTKASDIFSVAASSSQKTMKTIPVRHAAPEILQTNGEISSYSEKSDVYSMAVLMWEACSCGTIPFDSLVDDSDVRRCKLRGDQLSRPKICDEDLWSIIVHCWRMEPAERPTFKELRRKIIRLAHESDST
jgi:serine/threonine protein kinase